MESLIRKLWYSIIISTIMALTTVTTTFAWYAYNYTNDIEDFTFNLESTFDLLISTDGENFKYSLTSEEVIEAALRKRGFDTSVMSTEEMKREFAKFRFDAVTPVDYNDLTKGFETIGGINNDFEISNSYLSFDLYFSTNAPENYRNDTLYGIPVYTTADQFLSSPNKEINLGEFGIDSHPTLGSLDKTIMVNAVNAFRIGTSKFEVCAIEEENTIQVLSDSIYYCGSEEPEIREGVYDFGGINTEYNVALDYYNHFVKDEISLPINDRVDLPFGYNKMFEENEGLIKGRKAKITIYMWIEGWDSDCFNAICGQPIDVQLSFTSQI